MSSSTTQPANSPTRLTTKSLSTADMSQGTWAEVRFRDIYRIKREIADGSFGVVYLAEHRESMLEFAVKVIEKNGITDKVKLSINREVSILKDCQDIKNVVRLSASLSSTSRYYIVQEYAPGGDVFYRLALRETYTENDARNLARNLIETVKVLHSRRIAHRDLKPENLLLRDVLNDSEIMLADFGLASYVPPGKLHTRCGSPAFVAPEVIEAKPSYDERVDMWSVGCILYVLLGGYLPFKDRNHKGLFRKSRKADFVFHDGIWKNVSIAAKQLIASLLIADPQYRTTAKGALQSSWLNMDTELLRSNDLTASLGEIKKFHAKRSLQHTVQAIRSSVKSKFNKTTGNIDAADQHDYEMAEREETEDSLCESQSCSGKEALMREYSDSILVTTVRPSVSFHDVYEQGDLIGVGTHLFECFHRQTRRHGSVKIIERTDTIVSGKTMAEAVYHEVSILDSLKHRNIVKIKEYFDDDAHFYLTMAPIKGGDVFDEIVRRGRFAEDEARELFRSLVSGVSYLHDHRIAHRDLKPQNLLLRSRRNPSDIIISGFAYACRVDAPQCLTFRCGTPSYVAPEILKNIPYDQSADMWSVGVILYALLCGHNPFEEEVQAELFRKIRTAEWNFKGPHWNTVSDDAKQIIRSLLVVNPAQRWSARRVLKSSWLSQNTSATPSSPTSVVCIDYSLRERDNWEERIPHVDPNASMEL